LANNKIKLKKNNKKEEEEHSSTISILTVMKTSIKKSINHDSLFKEIDHQYQSFMRKIEIGCTGYEFIPSFQVRFT
jgi:hypothetical protein